MATLTTNREIYETGNEPEYVVNDLSRWEDAGDGMIRVFVVSHRGKIDRVEYSVVCSPERLDYICRKGHMFAAEAQSSIAMRAAKAGH
jgi:hypothetical protein